VKKKMKYSPLKTRIIIIHCSIRYQMPTNTGKCKK
jgi:hypothetical protein